ncbi:MAG TPA: MFS transporter [Thermoanaerobaculia bacterium]|nr:MFS transporter [Thermoanaerobaculia bacterium]
MASSTSADAGRTPPRGRAREALRALRHRDFRLFFGGQAISLIGTWMQTVAESWLVYRLTGSEVLLGFVGFAGQVPVFLLAPFGGELADRHDRRWILVGTQSAAMLLALTLAILTLTGRIVVWEVFALGALLGVVNAVDIPTRQSFFVEAVGREDLVNAIALNSSMFNAARIVGPAVAGILVASIGEGWCFFANALSYVAVIGGLIAMRRTRVRSAAPRVSTLRRVAEGFRFSSRTAPVRAILLLLAVTSLAGTPYSVLMPVFAETILHAGARGLGILMAASGVGALIGSIALALRRQLRGLGNWVAWAALALGLALPAFSLSRSFAASVLLLVPVGFAFMVTLGSANTLIQAMVPDALRGRVMAVYSMMFMGMAPFGALIAGALAGRIGAPHTVAAGGAIIFVAGALFLWRLPSLRGEARTLIRYAASEPVPVPEVR